MFKSGEPEYLEGKDFITFLNSIEEEISPSSCMLPYFNYWPIIRFAINYKRKQGKNYLDRELPKVHLLRLLKQILFQNYAKLKNKNILSNNIQNDFSHLPTSEILFLNRKTQYISNQQGQMYQPFTDSLRVLLGIENSSVSLVNESPLDNSNHEFLTPTQIMPKANALKVMNLLSPRNNTEKRYREKVLKTVASVNKIISKSKTNLNITEFEILYRIEQTARMVDYFETLFEQIKPKFIFLSSFSGAHFICAAAKKRGIKVVDIQHGGLNAHHAIVSNWKNAPKQGYELLPDIFWCWSERSAKYIQFPDTDAHKKFIGGSPKAIYEKYLSKQKLNRQLEGQENEIKARLQKPSKRPKVLVALQYGKENIIDQHIKEAYEKTKHENNWYFRLHPMGLGRSDELLKEVDIPKTQVEVISQLKMHEILPFVDVVLTSASTIVHEALDVGVRPAVWSRMGAAIFEDLISEGKIKYIDNLEAVLEFIDKSAMRGERQIGNNEEVFLEVEKIRRKFNYLTFALTSEAI